MTANPEAVPFGEDGAVGKGTGDNRVDGREESVPGGSVTVRMPSQLRSLTGGSSEVKVRAGTVREVIAGLEQAHPGVRARLLDEDGALRRFVNVFVADEDVRFLDGLDTPVADGQSVSVIPAVAGG